MSNQRNTLAETQPRTYRPTLRGLLSLPYRICNPPPAVGKVRSCGVTPLLKVRLQDVLDRKHLPPLGLKDFEEWLLYVEMSPENLYFTLWLKEYTTKYHQWAAKCKAQRDGTVEDCIDWSAPSSSQLAIFYARAKQTFFIPNAEYELNLPSSILAPFHSPEMSPHPDPLMFAEVARETHKMLEESLRRFVQAQLNNVGNNRVLCGIIAGTLICLAGAIPPIVVNFATGQTRWTRLAAFPALWVGLTIILAALNGVCMGVYIFGDLRQLRKFELARPPISKPQPLPQAEKQADHILPITQTLQLTVVPPPPAHLRNTHRLTRTPTSSSDVSLTSNSSSSSSSDSSAPPPEPIIHISAAYYDPELVDGPAISPILPEAAHVLPFKFDESTVDELAFVNTAAFIHPYDHTDDDFGSDVTKFQPEERQPISSFDFDALPYRPYCIHRPDLSDTSENKINHRNSVSVTPMALIELLQSKCAAKKWQDTSSENDLESCSARTPRSSFGMSVRRPEEAEARSCKKLEEAVIQNHLKKIKAVPAFASMTRVLSPIIVRGQWEIVIRSTAISLFFSIALLGSLLAIPVPVIR